MRARRRVLLATDSPGRGGAEISLGHLLAGASDAWEVHLACPTPAVLDWLAARRPGVPAHLAAGGLAGTAGLLARLRPDVVHVNQHSPWAAAALLAAALALPRTRVVAVEQLPMRTTALPELLRTRALMLRLDAHVAVGAASARRIEDFYLLGRGSVRSIPNGVPDLGPARERPPVRGELVVASLGRLDRVKGYDVLLHALVDAPGVRAVVHGDGADRARLADLAQRLGVADRVAWPGWAEDARPALAAADAFVLPSRSEGFPLSIGEALLAGLPVVATSVGSVPEALDDGRAGLLVPPDDPAGLAAALRRLRDDPELRRDLAAAGRAHAAQHATAAAMVRAYEALWREVLAAPRARRLGASRPRP